MRALVQRVLRASVHVDDAVVASIEHGLLALVGVGERDASADADRLAGRIATVRIFPGSDGRMRHDVAAAGGGVLVVSQFTLYGDLAKGNRPSFTAAAPPEMAERLVDEVAERLAARSLPVGRGAFGATMRIEAVLDGPVTIWLDTAAHRPAGRGPVR